MAQLDGTSFFVNLSKTFVLLMLAIHGLTAAVRLGNHANSFPRILTHTYNQTLNLSDTAILTCHVFDLGDHHVTWLKFDPLTSTFLPLAVGQEVFTSDKRYSVSSYSTSPDDSYWHLEIYQIRSHDEGIFECKIANRRASVAIRIYLQVQIPMTIQPSRLFVEPGSSVELDCTIYTPDKSLITWHFSSHNQTHVYNHHDVQERQQYVKNISISQLIIRQAQTYHSGWWTCNYKRQRRSARLLVEKGALQHHHHYEQQRLLSSNHSPSHVQCTISLILFALLLGHHLTHRI